MAPQRLEIKVTHVIKRPGLIQIRASMFKTDDPRNVSFYGGTAQVVDREFLEEQEMAFDDKTTPEEIDAEMAAWMDDFKGRNKIGLQEMTVSVSV